MISTLAIQQTQRIQNRFQEDPCVVLECTPVGYDVADGASDTDCAIQLRGNSAERHVASDVI